MSPSTMTTTSTAGRAWPMKCLADTSALLAMTLKDDRHHARAKAFLQSHPQARFVVTDLILSELVTRLRARVSADRAVAAARSLLASRRYEVLFVDAVILDGGLQLMERFADQPLSLADCVSFEVMVRLHLTAAFAFDDDFRKCGFQMVP